MKRMVVINSTPYDGTLERACLKLGVPCLSLSDVPVNHGYALTTTANILMQDHVYDLGTSKCVACTTWIVINMYLIFRYMIVQ